MQTLSPDAIVVSDQSFSSSEISDIVESNISFINALFMEYLKPEEISPDALCSYYVDYYLAEVDNGGFSQFVYNTEWSPQCVEPVREGLQAMQAKRHLELFEEGAKLVEQFGQNRLGNYFDSEYFGENADRDEFNSISDRFLEIDEQENLLNLNASWLRSHPNLVVLTVEQMEAEVQRRAQSLPDREQRIAEERANEPRYLKLIRALCDRAGHEFKHIMKIDPNRRHEGVKTTAWHFITDKGRFHMIEANGKAIMFRKRSLVDRVCEVEAPE